MSEKVKITELVDVQDTNLYSLYRFKVALKPYGFNNVKEIELTHKISQFKEHYDQIGKVLHWGLALVILFSCCNSPLNTCYSINNYLAVALSEYVDDRLDR